MIFDHKAEQTFVEAGVVVSTNISTTPKASIKESVFDLTIDKLGVVGDVQVGCAQNLVSLLSVQSINTCRQKSGRAVVYGNCGENITYRSIGTSEFGVLDQLKINDLLLEIVKMGTQCHRHEHNTLAKCVLHGNEDRCNLHDDLFFTRVIHPGKIAADDKIMHAPYQLKILLINIKEPDVVAAQSQPNAFVDDKKCHSEDKQSDGKNSVSGSSCNSGSDDGISTSASTGTAGGASTSTSHCQCRGNGLHTALQMIEQFFISDSLHTRWHWQLKHVEIPCDAIKLSEQLQHALREKADIIFTLGGIGIGAKDITPEVVSKVCDKLMPEVMEQIRLKYGVEHPTALLSRGIAGITDKTQIYTLPTNETSTAEYLTEIFKILEHVIFMLHGLEQDI
jgi:molybdopterin biosynthesis enzyme MoaB/MOSC domain-containing protein YiiM